MLPQMSGEGAMVWRRKEEEEGSHSRRSLS